MKRVKITKKRNKETDEIREQIRLLMRKVDSLGIQRANEWLYPLDRAKWLAEMRDTARQFYLYTNNLTE